MNYIVKLSDKTEVQIEESELSIVLDGIRSGSPVKVKQGIFNPSFFVVITEDEDRQITRREVFNPNKPNNTELILTTPPPLRDIFENVLKKISA